MICLILASFFLLAFLESKNSQGRHDVVPTKEQLTAQPAANPDLRPAKEILGRPLKIGRTVADSGDILPRELARNATLRAHGLPENDNDYSNYIQKNSKVVCWFAARLKLVRGIGLVFKKTGLRLDIDRANDSDNYPGYDEYLALPDVPLIIGSGDCDDRTISVCSLLRALDVPAMCVIGRNGTVGHAWVEYRCNGKFYISDFDRDSIWTADYQGYHRIFMFNDTTAATFYDSAWCR